MTKRTKTVKRIGGYPLAFTEQKNEMIRKDLLDEALHCAVTIGMRKTSVEQLTEAAGIAKGSFYKFFPSKELLFFAVLENIHTETYAVAEKALQDNGSLPPTERAIKIILAACKYLSDTKAMIFIENDAEYLLRRIPADIKTDHYHNDEVHIRQILETSGLVPKGGVELTTATIRGLILTVSHQGEIGSLYPQVLETLVRGACKELFD